MPDWPAFAGIAGVVLAILLLLARVSQAAIDRDEQRSDGVDPAPVPVSTTPADESLPDEAVDATGRGPPTRPAGPDGPPTPAEGAAASGDRDADDGDAVGEVPTACGSVPPERAVPRPATRDPDRAAGRATAEGTAAADRRAVADEPTTAVLLLNVALSQGVLGAVLLAGAWYTGVPAAALGAGPGAAEATAVGGGLALGVALYAANEAGAAVGRRAGFGGGEELRRALAPSSTAGWAVLLLVVLPVIAGFEELLFRGVLVGALHAGFGVSPWLLAALSSVAFAAGHGAQGRVGVLVTGTLGFVLAAAFVLTGSLLAVVVAHYLVNALEFLVHEWADVEPFGRRA